MKRKMLAVVLIAALALVSALALVAPASAVEAPPTGISPNEFATEHQGALGLCAARSPAESSRVWGPSESTSPAT